jgi:glycosyltransferase involved in cell wall biosynthesis
MTNRLTPAPVMPKKPLISIICPLFNEELSVGLFYEAMTGLIAATPYCHFELICIDDGSTDKTLDLLIQIAHADEQIKVIELSRNFGKEAALTAGIDVATGDAIIPFDCDLQDPPELIPKMIDEWQKGADIVIAKRIDRTSDTFLKRKSATLFYRFFNKISRVQIPENVGDFRLMNRQSIDAVKALQEHQRFMKGLFSWVGFKTVTIEYVRAPRHAGTTKFSGWKLWNFAIEGITSFSTAPLKVWMYIGIAGAVLSFCYGIFIFIRTLVIGIDVPGYASLLLAVLFLGSLQLISIGVLGEYIGRIYLETKMRPVYFIRRIHQLDNTKE